ncbi:MULTISPECIES: DNA cytosine methyltransferase [Streptomyces]|uniref:DNA cytosine methyltransferase n=1 Tax=Streptomyces TaxID=1883 RepID=UPI00345B6949
MASTWSWRFQEGRSGRRRGWPRELRARSRSGAGRCRGCRPEGIRITAREAGILQSFPAGYPWQGTKSAQFQQIGNAVPPLMAAHLLAPHLGARVCQDDFGLAA